MNDRTLVLRRERLAELAEADLGHVAGGRPIYPSHDCPDNTYYCITGAARCDLQTGSLLCP